MKVVSPFCCFDRANIVTLNYEYQPLNQYIAQLDKMRTICYGNEKKQSIYGRFKSVLNYILMGRCLSDELLSLILEKCKQSQLDREFLEIARCLYKLVNSYIDVMDIVNITINYVINSSNEDIYVLCNDESQWNMIKSCILSELLDNVHSITKKELRKNYVNGTLVLISPHFWLEDFVLYPTAKKTYIIQPSVMPIFELTRDIFKDFNGNDISLDNSLNINTKIFNVFIPYDRGCDSIFRPLESRDVNNKELDELIGQQSHIYSYELLYSDGEVKTIQYNKSYITVNDMDSVSSKVINDSSDISNVKYIVTDIDYSMLSHEDINRELKNHMERWKLPIRSYFKPHELPIKLTELGAIKASSQNIKNWASPNTIAPKSREDYLAVLAFAGIVKEEEVSLFFRLARNIRGSSISMGHHKADIAKEIVKDEIVKKLSAGENLPNKLIIGNVKAEILPVEGVIYG